MSADLLTLRASQALGLTLSAMLAGANVGISLTSIPALALPTVPVSQPAQQWGRLYSIGRSVAPPTALVAALFNGYVLYRAAYSWPTSQALWSSTSSSIVPNTTILGLSIVAQLLIVPFTLLFMEGGTNRRLGEYAERARKGGLRGEKEERLVRRELRVWNALNMARGVFPAAGAILGVFAALG